MAPCRLSKPEQLWLYVDGVVKPKSNPSDRAHGEIQPAGFFYLAAQAPHLGVQPPLVILEPVFIQSLDDRFSSNAFTADGECSQHRIILSGQSNWLETRWDKLPWGTLQCPARFLLDFQTAGEC